MLSSKLQYLTNGQHRFQIHFPITGIYSVSVFKNDGPLNFKEVCIGNKLQECKFNYSGSENSKQLKRAAAGKTLSYSQGDIVLYSVLSGKNNTIITDSPNTNKAYDVEFFECFDADKQNYPIVKIGTQWWIAENLKTTKYRDGAAIPNVTDNTTWDDLTSGAYCWNRNDTGNKAIYGALYNWYAVNTGKLCPTGWHVPSDAEWDVLYNYLTNNGYGYQGSSSDVAKSMAAKTNWNS
jgi:uncharacterized protein (TIGR02145 family)